MRNIVPKQVAPMTSMYQAVAELKSQQNISALSLENSDLAILSSSMALAGFGWSIGVLYQNTSKRIKTSSEAIVQLFPYLRTFLHVVSKLLDNLYQTLEE